jgi:Holliday junction resolvase RusA-like endonuclease
MTNSREELFFTVQGHPRPQGSKRYLGNGRFIEASDVHPWRKAIAAKVAETFVLSGDDRSFTEPVVVWATFRLPRPKTVKRLYPSVAPDLDKLQRALGDALSVDSQALTDDSLIVQWHSKKRYAPADQAGVSVTIRLAPQPNKEGNKE